MTKRYGAVLAITLLAAAACEDLTSLQQSNPGQLSAATAYVPANAQILVNGATEDFWCAFTRYVGGSALLMSFGYLHLALGGAALIAAGRPEPWPVSPASIHAA